MNKILISLIVIFFLFPLVSATQFDFSYSEKVYSNTSLDKVVIWNDYGDVAEIKLEIEIAGRNFTFSDKLIQKAQIEKLDLGIWGEFTHKFQVPNVTQGKKVDLLLDFKAKYNVSCNAEAGWFYFGDNKIQCGKINLDFNTLATEIFTANYKDTGGLTDYLIKPQSYSLTQDGNKIIATLDSKYLTETNPLKTFSAADLIMLDPTYTISNLSTNAVLSDVKCEGGGRYCHLAMNESLMTYLPFDVNDNLSGGVYYDWSSQDKKYTILRSVYNSTSFKYGGAITFKGGGVDDYIYTASNLGIGINTPMTVCFWAKNNAPTATAGIFNLQPTATAGDQRLTIYLGTALGVNGVAVSMTGENRGFNKGASVAIATQNWNHYCVTSKNTTSHIVLYVNGTDVSTAWASFLSAYGSTETSWGRGVTTSYHFVGNLDEAMVFNKTLSAGEVNAIYNGTFARFKETGNLSLNITQSSWYNKVNVTILEDGQQNSTGDFTNVSVLVKDINNTFVTPSVNLTNGTIVTFNISSASTHFNFTFQFFPEYTSYFSPLLKTNVILDFFDWTGPIKIESAESTNFIHPSIALDSLGVSHVSYINESGGVGMLKYCNNSGGDWSCLVVDDTHDFDASSSIAIDSNNKVHIVSTETGADGVVYCNNTGGTFSCNFDLDSSVNSDGFISLAIDKNNWVHIGFHDTTGNDMRYCNNTALGIFSCADIATSTEGYGNSIAIDSNNKVHLSYTQDSIPNIAKYCNNTAPTGAWSCMELPYSSGIDLLGGTSIAMDSNNKAHIAYVDSGLSYLYYCNNTASTGIFSCYAFTAASLEAYDCSPSLAMDSNNKVHLTYFNDAANTWSYCNNTALGIFSCADMFYQPTNQNDINSRWISIRKGRLVDANSYDNYANIVFYNVTSHSPYYYRQKIGEPSAPIADTTPPNVEVIDPTNKNYSTSYIPFNITLNEAAFSCNFSFDNFAYNYSMSHSGSNKWTATNITIADRWYSINYTCRDTTGNFNSTSWAVFQARSLIWNSSNVSQGITQSFSRTKDYNAIKSSSLKLSLFAFLSKIGIFSRDVVQSIDGQDSFTKFKTISTYLSNSLSLSSVTNKLYEGIKEAYLKISFNLKNIQMLETEITVSQAIQILDSVIGEVTQPPTEAVESFVSEAILLRETFLKSNEEYLTASQKIALSELLSKFADSSLSVWQKISLLEKIEQILYSDRWVSQAIDFSDFINRLEFKQNLQNQRMLLSSQTLRQQNSDISVFQIIDFFDILEAGGLSTARSISNSLGLGFSDDAIAYLRSDVSNVIGWYTLGARGKEAYVSISQRISLGDVVNQFREVIRTVEQEIIVGDNVNKSHEGYMRVLQAIRVFGSVSQIGGGFTPADSTDVASGIIMFVLLLPGTLLAFALIIGSVKVRGGNTLRGDVFGGVMIIFAFLAILLNLQVGSVYLAEHITSSSIANVYSSFYAGFLWVFFFFTFIILVGIAYEVIQKIMIRRGLKDENGDS